MLFGLIAGPVVLGPVDGAGLQRRVNLVVGHGHRRRAQRAHHVVHQLALRHADAQPGQVLQRLHGAHVVVKMPCAGVIPRKPHQAGAVQRRQELVPDLAVQHLPHVVAAAVEVGQLQYVELGHAVAQRHDRDAGKIQPAELQLLDDRGLVARDRVGVDVDDDAPAGAFLHQLGKALGAQGGGVVGGLVFGVGEHVLGHRLRRGGRRPRAGAQHGGGQRRGGGSQAGYSVVPVVVHRPSAERIVRYYLTVSGRRGQRAPQTHSAPPARCAGRGRAC